MRIIINNNEFTVINGNNFLKRLIGLTFKSNIQKGLYLPKCHSIHTFFMKDEIDIILLDKMNNIKYIYPSLKKRKVLIKKNIQNILEMPKNTISKYNIKVNDKIKIID